MALDCLVCCPDVQREETGKLNSFPCLSTGRQKVLCSVLSGPGLAGGLRKIVEQLQRRTSALGNLLSNLKFPYEIVVLGFISTFFTYL